MESTPGKAQTDQRDQASVEAPSVKRFVLEYIRAVTSDDTSTQEQFFAHRVNFYGEGVLSLRRVQASTERYRREWPVRELGTPGRASDPEYG